MSEHNNCNLCGQRKIASLPHVCPTMQIPEEMRNEDNPISSAELDAKLGMIELPPIRVKRHIYDALLAQANKEGVIMQQVVRTAIRQHLGKSESA